MVVGTVVAASAIIIGGKATENAAMAGASFGATAAGFTATGAATGSTAVGTSIGVGMSTGALAGASSGSVGGVVAGAVAGGASAAGVGGSGIGLGTLVAGIGTGGVGFLVIGTSVNSEDNKLTYDCWKPVVRDTSLEPSNGMLLKDLVSHPHVTKVTVIEGTRPELPNIVLQNVWDEEFIIEYYLLNNTNTLVGHAKSIGE